MCLLSDPAQDKRLAEFPGVASTHHTDNPSVELWSVQPQRRRIAIPRKRFSLVDHHQLPFARPRRLPALTSFSNRQPFRLAQARSYSM